VICSNCGADHDRDGRDLCFRCHVSGIRFAFKGSVMPGRKGWNRTAREYREENFGTSSEHELAKRGIERADKV
jgi:hypothetical protein